MNIRIVNECDESYGMVGAPTHMKTSDGVDLFVGDVVSVKSPHINSIKPNFVVQVDGENFIMGWGNITNNPENYKEFISFREVKLVMSHKDINLGIGVKTNANLKLVKSNISFGLNDAHTKMIESIKDLKEDPKSLLVEVNKYKKLLEKEID